MKTSAVVAGLGISGLVGGLIGVMLRQDAAHPRVPAVTADPVARLRGTDSDASALRALEERIGSLESALAEANREIIELRGAAEARAAVDSALEARVAEAERRGTPAIPDILARDGEPSPHDRANVEVLAARAAELGLSMEKIRSHRELARLSDEERWEKARDALSLSAHQEATLKEAIATYRSDLRAALEDKEVTGRDGTASIRLRMPNPEKARDARRAYADRIAGLLSEDQATKWNEKGFAGVLGAPAGDATTVSTQVIVEPR